jgi:hypothetical protein
MAGAHPVYRSLLRLYPKPFRAQYGDDLVQQLADLITDRGARAAWARVSLDLIVTVPRYRLESVMNEQHSETVVKVVITLLAAGGVVGLLTDFYPGIVPLVVALAFGIGQRSTLSKAIRTPDSNRRRRRLVTGGILAVVFVGCYVAFDLLIGESWTIRETLLSLVGIPAMFGAIVYLIAGLLTPRSPHSNPSVSTP